MAVLSPGPETHIVDSPPGPFIPNTLRPCAIVSQKEEEITIPTPRTQFHLLGCGMFADIANALLQDSIQPQQFVFIETQFLLLDGKFRPRR
jgi:hypothetical protein